MISTLSLTSTNDNFLKSVSQQVTQYGPPMTLFPSNSQLWEKAKSEIRSILIIYAKAKTIITYTELTRRIQHLVHLNPRLPPLHDMLEEVSLDEADAGHGLLSVLVVGQEKEIPGVGFFRMAKNYYRADVSDPMKFFSTEVAKVYDYWSKADR